MCVCVCVRVCVPRVFISLIDTTSVGAWVAVGRSNDKYCVMMWCWCLIWYVHSIVLFYILHHFFLCFRLRVRLKILLRTILCLSFDALSSAWMCRGGGGGFCSPIERTQGFVLR